MVNSIAACFLVAATGATAAVAVAQPPGRFRAAIARADLVRRDRALEASRARSYAFIDRGFAPFPPPPGFCD
jgi:hypothetical protein